jgi:Tol biopolymer transport system component
MNVVNVENGSIRVVGEVPKAHVNIELAWSPDSRRIAFNDDNVIKIMNIDDGKIEDIKTNLVDVEIWHLDWSPDGEQFVFSGMKGGNAEFWFLENFLPLEKLAQKNKPEDLSIRKVLSDAPSEPLGTPSPDGRYISFVDWDSGGNICIMDLKTKEKRCLTNYTDPYEQAYYSSWSTDGNNIAYTWWDKVGTNLSVVDIKESKSRVLLKSDKVDWIELGNWSSDGKYIVATLSLPGQSESQIVRISSSDGSIQILKTFEKSYLGGKPYFSPDNSYVAYNVPDEKVSGNCDIYIFSLEDEHENALFKHPAHDYILGWTPDGKNILFASDRTGTMDAMIIGVEEGKSIGQPKSIIQNVGPITPMGFTQKGSFYYGQWPETQNIYTAKIDFENGKILTQPTLAIRRYEGKNHAPSYSNNGKFLAYISDRGFSSRIAKPVNVLCIRDLETDKESEIIPDPEIGLIRSLLWSPDDRSITIMCFNQEKYARIYDYDIQTKKFTPLVPGSNDHLSDMNYIYPLWSRDGKLLYYLQASRNSQSSRIMIRNIVTGNESELYRYSSNDYYDRIFTLSLSPDGKWLSAISIGVNKVVKLISTSDGKARDLYTFKSATGEGPYSQLWSRDGKYIIFPYPKKPTSGELEWNLMRIPFEGGENQLIKMDILGIYDPSLHPDGRTLSFESTGYSKPENNIWAMENFLPK